MNSEFPKQTEIGSGAPERKRPYPALFRILQAEAEDKPRPAPKPPWLKARPPGGPNYLRLKALTKELSLHTVCEEARCPNIGECWGAGTLTFMILGRVCTRNCGFCAVTFGKPPDYDPEEPDRVAKAVGRLGLAHVVVTKYLSLPQAEGIDQKITTCRSETSSHCATSAAIRKFTSNPRGKLLSATT